jgi:hypothetical protein
MAGRRTSIPPSGPASAVASALALAVAVASGCDDVTVQVLAPAASASASAAPSCAPPAAAACEGQLDDECRDAKQCCSGACVVADDDKKRCARAVSCASFCEDCEAAEDCCSGRCEEDGTGRSVCWSGECRAQGELCEEDADCCAEAGPVHCVEDPVGLKSRRCRLDSSGPPCVGDGARCAEAGECCSGFCVGGGKPEPVCARDCVVDGDPCTTSADCCTLSASCAGDGDTPVCGVVVR